jgi:hypothetical protein
MERVTPKETISKQDNRSTPTQNKFTRANATETAVLSQNNMVKKVVSLLDSKISRVLRNSVHIF